MRRQAPAWRRKVSARSLWFSLCGQHPMVEKGDERGPQLLRGGRPGLDAAETAARLGDAHDHGADDAGRMRPGDAELSLLSSRFQHPFDEAAPAPTELGE